MPNLNQQSGRHRSWKPALAAGFHCGQKEEETKIAFKDPASVCLNKKGARLSGCFICSRDSWWRALLVFAVRFCVFLFGNHQCFWCSNCYVSHQGRGRSIKTLADDGYVTLNHVRCSTSEGQNCKKVPLLPPHASLRESIGIHSFLHGICRLKLVHHQTLRMIYMFQLSKT